jgi:hypothetical protein
MSNEDRYLRKLEILERKAEPLIGELCKEGKTVYYIWPIHGKYREGSHSELVDFLIRNKYVR